jgi:glycosidase
MDFRFNAEFFWQVLQHYEAWYPPPYTPVLVLGNHDSRRWIDRLGGDTQKAKLISLLQYTARGIPVSYYGEEIGMPEGNFPARTALDPVGKKYAWAPNWLLKMLKLYVNRDNCRTPMVWENSPNGGFTDGEVSTWLPLSAGPACANVASQEDNPDSLLNWYRSLLKIRQGIQTLRTGTLKLLPRDLAKNGLLGFIRKDEFYNYAVLINTSANSVAVDLPGGQIEIQTGKIDLHSDNIRVNAFSGCIVNLSGQPTGD